MSNLLTHTELMFVLVDVEPSHVSSRNILCFSGWSSSNCCWQILWRGSLGSWMLQVTGKRGLPGSESGKVFCSHVRGVGGVWKLPRSIRFSTNLLAAATTSDLYWKYIPHHKSRWGTLLLHGCCLQHIASINIKYWLKKKNFIWMVISKTHPIRICHELEPDWHANYVKSKINPEY